MNNIENQKFGRLTAIRFDDGSVGNKPKWVCLCDCGNEKSILYYNLLKGNTISCGCAHTDMMKAKFTKHGERVGRKMSVEYSAWHRMKQRCYDETHKDYPKWGGRGIKVCGRWLESFDNFLLDVGRRPSSNHSLDRYPNNDGNYEPGNFRWATKKEQAVNRRSTKWYEYNGEKKMLKDWAETFGVHSSDVNYFLKKKGKTFDFVYDYYMNNKVRRRNAVSTDK